MRPSHALQSHREAVRQIVLQHHALNVRVFGSVLRGEDTDDSDLDLLIEPTQETTLMDIGAIRYELRKLLGISVDVLTLQALPKHFRKQILYRGFAGMIWGSAYEITPQQLSHLRE